MVSTEGISRITGADVAAAAAFGGVVRLIGRAKKYPGGRVHILVAPMMGEKRCLLSRVDGVFNAILVRGNAIGDVGRGVGNAVGDVGRGVQNAARSATNY